MGFKIREIYNAYYENKTIILMKEKIMFREIRTREKITDLDSKKEGSKGYQNIKPETDITYEEAKKFVEGLFMGLELS